MFYKKIICFFALVQFSSFLKSADLVIFIPDSGKENTANYYLLNPVKNSSAIFYTFNWKDSFFLHKELTDFLSSISEEESFLPPSPASTPASTTSSRIRVAFDSQTVFNSSEELVKGEFKIKLEEFINSTNIEEQKMVAAILLAFKIIKKKIENPSIEINIIAQGVGSSQIAHLASNLLFPLPNLRSGGFSPSFFLMVLEPILSSLGPVGIGLNVGLKAIYAGGVITKEIRDELRRECEIALHYNPEYLDISRVILGDLLKQLGQRIIIKNMITVGSSFNSQSCFPDMKVVDNYCNFYTERDYHVFGNNKLSFSEVIKNSLYLQNHYFNKSGLNSRVLQQIESRVYQIEVVRSRNNNCYFKSCGNYPLKHDQLLRDQGLFQFISTLVLINHLQNNFSQLQINLDFSATVQASVKKNILKRICYKIGQCSCCYK